MFLTLEDPRARVKGSRDPLGVQPIWWAFGRKVVGNLTTQTNSCRGFAVLLLGRYLARQLLEDGRIGEEDALDAFLRFEQICGYARYLKADEPEDATERILGIERISRRSREPTVTIDAAGEAAILSNQRAYGLWGLYSVSARASRLLPDGPVGVTEIAAAFVEEHYLPQLETILDPLKAMVRDGGTLPLKGQIVDVLGKALSGRLEPAEREFFRQYLCTADRDSSKPNGQQATFCRLLERHADLRRGISRGELEAIRKDSNREDLANRIAHILTVEALLAPCDVIFGFLRARHGQTPEAAASELRGAWGDDGPPHLRPGDFENDVLPQIAKVTGKEVEGHIREAHRALSRGDYEAVIREMLPWNEVVMANRNAAPWIRLDEQDGTLDVRYRGPEQRLPERNELESLWRYSYFINALKALLAQTSEAAAGAAR